MNHYYSSSQDDLKSSTKEIVFQILEKTYKMDTDYGVFSKQGLDFGSRVLIESILPLNATKILDLGSGYGPIGIVLKKETNAIVTLVDINERAISLAKENARKNKAIVTTILSDGFKFVDDTFDVIVTNPPIRAGKSVYYPWFKQSYDHLTEKGCLFLVIQKKQGAPSAISELQTIFREVAVISKKSGYYVIKCEK